MGGLQSVCLNDDNRTNHQLPVVPIASDRSESKDTFTPKQKDANLLPAQQYFTSLNMTQNMQKQIYRNFSGIQISNQRNNCEISLSKNSKNLIHKKIPITIDKFIKYDWQDVQKIDFAKCMLSDRQWRIFVENANLFTELKILNLDQNYINQVKDGDLQCFRKLRFISFGGYGKSANPLNKQSIRYLSKFKLDHPEPKFWLQYLEA